LKTGHGEERALAVARHALLYLVRFYLVKNSELTKMSYRARSSGTTRTNGDVDVWTQAMRGGLFSGACSSGDAQGGEARRGFSGAIASPSSSTEGDAGIASRRQDGPSYVRDAVAARRLANISALNIFAWILYARTASYSQDGTGWRLARAKIIYRARLSGRDIIARRLGFAIRRKEHLFVSSPAKRLSMTLDNTCAVPVARSVAGRCRTMFSR